jgi:hypothetical protein
MMVSLQNVNLVAILVHPVKMPTVVLLVLKEEITSIPVIVLAQMANMMLMLLNVPLVPSNVPLVSTLLIIVSFVPKTESEPQIVIVTSKMVVMKFLDKLIAQLVTIDV